MDIPLKHVIGTIALIGLIIAVGLAYTIITSFIEADVNKKQLNQIAEHVALNLVEVISLTNFANFMSNETMMKVLKLPFDLGGKAYLIKLVMFNETGESQGYYVQTQLVTRNDITAKSLIPLNTTQTQQTLVTDGDGTLLVRGGTAGTIQFSSIVYGGVENVVVWGWKMYANLTLAGIGIWKTQGGT